MSENWTIFFIWYKKLGALFTKLTYAFEASFGNFLLWNTLNFNTVNYNFYSILPSSQEMKIFGEKKNILSMLFWILKFRKNLGISLSEHCEWGPDHLTTRLIFTIQILDSFRTRLDKNLWQCKLLPNHTNCFCSGFVFPTQTIWQAAWLYLIWVWKPWEF